MKTIKRLRVIRTVELAFLIVVSAVLAVCCGYMGLYFGPSVGLSIAGLVWIMIMAEAVERLRDLLMLFETPITPKSKRR